MKTGRFLVLALLAVVMFGVVGCGSSSGGSKTVTCTMTSAGTDLEMNVHFDGNKVASMDMNAGMDLSNYSDSQIKILENQDFCSSIKNYMYSYKEAFTNCKQNISNKQLKITADLDIDKIVKSEMDKMATPEDAKKGLEAAGYSCTIK